MTGSNVQSIEPRTGLRRDLGVAESTDEDVAAAAAAARKACAWLASRSPQELSSLLLSMAQELEARRDQLVAAADAETALGLARLNGELTRAIYQFQLFADECASGALFDATIDTARDDTPLPQPELRRMNVGLGVVAVFAASNFPFAFSVPGTDTASALAARCAVVVKAHSAHPRTSMLALDALHEAALRVGAPTGLVGLVHGRTAGVALAENSDIAAIAFTGSQSGGMALHRIASTRADPIPFYGELGGMNPLIVTAGALEERGDAIAAGVLDSALLGMGQFCTKPGLILIEAGDAAERFTVALRTALDNRPGGVLLAERIRDAFEAAISDWTAYDGVEVLRSGDAAGGGWYARPTLVFADVAALHTHPQLMAECFGPVTVVSTFADMAELRTTLDVLEPALTASVHIGARDDVDEVVRLRDELASRAGRVVFNGYPTGVAVSRAQHHGGPWPATTNPLYTSVGLGAAKRFLRPVAFQNCPQALLPEPLRDTNPWGVPQTVDGVAVAAGAST